MEYPEETNRDTGKTFTHYIRLYQTQNTLRLACFGLYVETGAPEVNPHIYGENIQTLYRKDPDCPIWKSFLFIVPVLIYGFNDFHDLFVNVFWLLLAYGVTTPDRDLHL